MSRADARASAAALIRGSTLFDADWYCARYRDVRQVGIDPAEHYLRIGARLMRDPGPGFSTTYYVGNNSDVRASGINPLVHYLVHGRQEGRRCRPSSGASIVGSGATPPGARDGNRSARMTVRTHAGHRAARPGARTVLVCAHVAGEFLFGGERSLLDILDGFVAAGHDAVVTVPAVGNLEYLEALRSRSVAVRVFPYDWWRKGRAVDEGVVATFARVIADHSIDAVHANTLMLREPLEAARRIGIPAVLHARELIAHDVALLDLVGLPPERIVEEACSRADWIVANSEATARAFGGGPRTRVLPNTVDTAVLDVPAPAPERETVAVALVSSNLPKKGILDFVEIANRLEHAVPHARFLLIGPDNDHVRALQARQAAGEISRNLVFAGYREDPSRAMAEADIVLNLSHFQESFGRTVLEAMAARRPVVAYDWGALPELVVEGETGYLVPFKDVAAAAKRVAQLCEDRAALAAMGERGRRRAVELYGHERYAERMGAIYADVFARTDAPVPRRILAARDSTLVAPPQAPPRIAYFLWHFPVPSETFVLNELRLLVAAGQDVEVFCRQSPHRGFQPDFPIRWTRVGDPDELAQALVASGRTIVHSHFVYPTVTEMVWPACERAGVPFTFIAHAQDIFRHGNDEKNRIGEIGRSPWCLRVLVPSRFHRRYLLERGVPAAKLLINPNGIDPELYRDGRVPDRGARTRRSICAIHRYTEKKGLENLIRAARLLAGDGVTVHLYGYGHLEPAYRSLIEQESIGNVHLHGEVGSRAEMLEVFREHDLFACPSVRAPDGDMDGIPTVLMEAMASGLPVLATALSGIPDLVRDEVTGIVCDPDPDGIARAVRRYYALPRSRVEAIIEDAESHVRERYNAVGLTRALLRVWQRRAIDVVIVSWNNLPQLREVVGRLQTHTGMPFHLIVCDNGSAPDVAAFLCEAYAEHPNVTVVFNRSNALVGPGTNLCLEQGRSDYAVYVCGKEGFVLDHGWEKSLIDYMDAEPEVGLAGTLCHSPTYLTGAQYPQAIPLFDRFRNRGFAAENPERRFGHVQGGFFVLRRAMYEAIGGFSDAVPHEYTDVEYSYYVESTGWKLGSPPRLLALYNKTRPGLFSRIDESVAATHPPTLRDLPLLDRIARADVAHCNLCGWHGDAFERRDAHAACPRCGSLPSDRSLYRFLAESMLTYRRLPALGIGVGSAAEAIWRQQFQGPLHSIGEVRESLRRAGRLDFNPGSRKLVYYDRSSLGDDADDDVLREIARVLGSDGMLLFRLGESAMHDAASDAAAVASACGLVELERRRYRSRVVGFDSLPLWVGRRAEAARCVS